MIHSAGFLMLKNWFRVIIISPVESWVESVSDVEFGAASHQLLFKPKSQWNWIQISLLRWISVGSTAIQFVFDFGFERWIQGSVAPVAV